MEEVAMNVNDVSDLAAKLKETLKDIDQDEDVTAMKETAKEVADVASEFIKKYPIQSVLGAVAIGFILGNLTSKRK
jgi:ElaB/YqjD/DUF883 family membrane-anchored ribosome-binding protein